MNANVSALNLEISSCHIFLSPLLVPSIDHQQPVRNSPTHAASINKLSCFFFLSHKAPNRSQQSAPSKSQTLFHCHREPLTILYDLMRRRRNM